MSVLVPRWVGGLIGRSPLKVAKIIALPVKYYFIWHFHDKEKNNVLLIHQYCPKQRWFYSLE